MDTEFLDADCLQSLIDAGAIDLDRIFKHLPLGTPRIEWTIMVGDVGSYDTPVDDDGGPLCNAYVRIATAVRLGIRVFRYTVVTDTHGVELDMHGDYKTTRERAERDGKRFLEKIKGKPWTK